MTFKVGIRPGDTCTNLIAMAVGLVESGGSIDASTLDVCREFAFSANSAEEFSDYYLRSEIFSKFLVSDEECPTRSATTWEKFHAAEQRCAESNSRLVDWFSRAHLDHSSWARARSLVGAWLGPFPWESFPAACGFGPGATLRLARVRASHQNKWALSTHITEGALPYHDAFLHWARVGGIPSEMDVVTENRVTTVPKNYKTDRTIAIEPDWNMFYQKAVGRLIRRRLQSLGILLPEAQSINQALARLGSWTGSLATLDLSAASDSVSVALCEALLPDDWFKVLMDLRSPSGVTPHGVVTYAKISSMGNGFTFELETLLFYALMCAVCRKEDRHRISVYGDDIIVPTSHVEAATAILAEAGFSLNDDKSFSSGPFRESCGGHYWKGQDVKPVYVRKPPQSVGALVVHHNQLIEWCSKNPRSEIRFDKTIAKLRSLVPKIFRGPYGHDGVLWSEWDECTPYWFRDFQSYRQFRIESVITRSSHAENWGGVLHSLWTELPDDVSIELAYHLKRDGLRERKSKYYVDRESWKQLPVRLA